MGEIYLYEETKELVIHSTLILYGSAADDEIAHKIREDIEDTWNACKGTVVRKEKTYRVRFKISAFADQHISPDHIHSNLDPQINFFRIEPYCKISISYVDAIGCNTGYFLLDNVMNSSKTAAHEYGHTLGLDHPAILDIRGAGRPGIMYPRGTLVDAPFQWDPSKPAGTKGGTLNPSYRQVLQNDINGLHLDRLTFNRENKTMVGDFTNLFHTKH